MKTKEVKRLEATERNLLYKNLTIQQKLDRLKSVGCFDKEGNLVRNKRQVTRLLNELNKEVEGEKICSNLKK